MERLSLEWKTDDGLSLTARNWKPETEPKALICLVHGLGEHSGRYYHLGNYLKGAGYALLAFDVWG